VVERWRHPSRQRADRDDDRAGRPGAILHWFLGTDHDIDRAIDGDAFFSVNEAMLNSERGRRVIDGLPPNRVVLETDAPDCVTASRCGAFS
jgi:Tat protein secretion system quality control protein TatD with DNase activity